MAMGEKRNGTGSGFFRSARRVLVRSSGERVSAAGPGLPFGGSSPTYNRAGRIVRPRFLLGLCPGILLSFGEKNKVNAPEARASLPGEGAAGSQPCSRACEAYGYRRRRCGPCAPPSLDMLPLVVRDHVRRANPGRVPAPRSMFATLTPSALREGGMDGRSGADPPSLPVKLAGRNSASFAMRRLELNLL